MKFNKSLIALAVAGAMTVPALQAAEHTFSWSGNLRVQSFSDGVIVSNNGTETVVENLVTSFGGLDDQSTTGGDTYLQLNYHYESDDGVTTADGGIRFASDREIRIGVRAESELGDYEASMYAEWGQLGWVGADGVGGVSRTDRDQFAVLTHKPTNLYFKIGREEWFGNEKGYITDFLSHTKGYADTGTKRFAGHLLGWKDSDLGLDVGLFIQRDNTGQASARPFGYEFKDNPDPNLNIVNDDGDRIPGDRQQVNGFGIIAKYGGEKEIVDVEFITGRATASTDEDRGLAEYERAVALTQVHLSLPLKESPYKPFVNFGTATITDTDGGTETEETLGGLNLGVSIGFGDADLVVAFGSAADENAAGVETTNSGFDVMFATNQEPLLVSLAYTTDTEKVGDADGITTSNYGVRFDYGF